MPITDEQLTGKTQSHITWLCDNIGIHSDVVAPYLAMQAAAKKSGITIEIVSGFRDFNRQLGIWNRKFNGALAVKNINNQVVDITQLSEQDLIQAICLYSAIPGTSRHHWGTDIDVYDPTQLPKNKSLQLEPWEYEQGGYFHPLHAWLKEHAESFGFYFPYDQYRGGVAAEPWHLSYTPIADEYLKNYHVNTFTNAIKETAITGRSTLLNEAEKLLHSFVYNINKKEST